MKTAAPKTRPAKNSTSSTTRAPATGEARAIDKTKAEAFVERAWEGDIVPKITEYIRIPNKSPHFDAKWQESGHMKKAADLIEA